MKDAQEEGNDTVALSGGYKQVFFSSSISCILHAWTVCRRSRPR